MTLDHANIVELETIANAAMPARETQPYDGWLLHFSESQVKRTNSVHPLTLSTYDLDEKIAFCAAQYRERHQAIIYKMTPVSQPPELDARLETLGYARISPTLMQICSLPAENLPAVELQGSAELSQEWLETYQHFDPIKASSLQAVRDTFMAIPYPIWYAITRDEAGHISAIGQGVLQGDYMGVFAIVVEESQRGRGLGRQIMNTLLTWGAQQGAQNAYLQVTATNEKAINLYRSLGFRTAYEYWYRTLDS